MASESSHVPITAQPAAGQLVQHNETLYETKQEGLAFILIPPGTQTSVDPQANAKADIPNVKPQNVFYNPIQRFNRDLSVLAIKAFGEDWVERRKLKNEQNKARLGRKQERHKEKRARKRKLAEVVDTADPSAAHAGGTNASEAGLGSTADAGLIDGIHQDQRQPEESSKGDNIGGEPNVDVRTSNSQVHNGVEDTQAQGIIDTIETHASNGADQNPHQPRFRILDALSASGLRALRYAKEIPFASSVVANDMSANAVKSMVMNIQHNDLNDKITPNTGDAIGHMYRIAYPPHGSHGPHYINNRYDVIDLDPYGTAVPFLDAALQALNDNGLLCVTCTDSGVFASCGYSEKTYALYGGMPVKGSHMHEGGLRLILHSIASTAAKHGISIEPLISLSIDFYARVFVRVSKSAADVKFLAGKTMLVYDCDAGCGAWTTQMLGRNVRQPGKNGASDWFKYSVAQAPTADRLCQHCQSKMHVAGPMWGGPLHNAAFVQKILADLETADEKTYQTKERIEGMLMTTLEELSVNDELTRYTRPQAHSESDAQSAKEVMIPKVPVEALDSHPFFFNPSALSKVVHCVAPNDASIKGALRSAGYRAARSHCQPGVIKTDAPWTAIWEIMREWVRQKHPIKEGVLRKEHAGWRIMYGSAVTDATTTNNDSKDSNHDEATRGNADGDIVPTGDATKLKVVFDEALGRDKPGKRLLRYQQNPRENWGPMARAKGS